MTHLAKGTGCCALLITLLMASACASAQQAAPERSACESDDAAMFRLTVKEFDQTIDAGWRPLGNTSGCELAAADLIQRYTIANAQTLVVGRPSELASLHWHQAQLRAAAGQTKEAVALFKKARPVVDPGRVLMADATLAFLARDMPALQKARDGMASLPKPEGFDEAAAEFKRKTGREIRHNQNLDVIDGFIRCFDKGYKEAYSIRCRATGE